MSIVVSFNLLNGTIQRTTLVLHKINIAILVYYKRSPPTVFLFRFFAYTVGVQVKNRARLQKIETIKQYEGS